MEISCNQHNLHPLFENCLYCQQCLSTQALNTKPLNTMDLACSRLSLQGTLYLQITCSACSLVELCCSFLSPELYSENTRKMAVGEVTLKAIQTLVHCLITCTSTYD